MRSPRRRNLLLLLGIALALGCSSKEGSESTATEAAGTDRQEGQTAPGQYAIKGQAAHLQLSREEAIEQARNAGILGAGVLGELTPSGAFAATSFSGSSGEVGGEAFGCPQACERLIELTMDELDRTVASLTPELAARLKTEAASSRDRDQAQCVAKCQAGHLIPSCVQTLKRIDDVGQCKPKSSTDSRTSEQAISAARTICARIDEGAGEGSCSQLAADLDSVNQILRNAKGAHEDEDIDRCVDVVIDLQEERCASDAAFKTASDLFMMVMLAQ